MLPFDKVNKRNHIACAVVGGHGKLLLFTFAPDVLPKQCLICFKVKKLRRIFHFEHFLLDLQIKKIM